LKPNKYRAWDAHKKQFLSYPCYINHLDPNEFTCFDRWFKADEEGVTFQQFTGKLDINGKEIYEGDLVQVVYATQHDLPDDPLGVYEVIYDPDSACWCLMVHKKNWIDFEMVHDVEPGDKLPLLRYRNVCRVIGNIYENPELLLTF